MRVVSMPVSMMRIRVVRMPMPEPDMSVPMRVRLADGIIGRMAVPMMLVMNVAVHVIDRRMFVLVLMPLGQMQPHADSHEHPCDGQLQADGLAEPDDRNDRSHEGGRGIIRTRPGRS